LSPARDTRSPEGLRYDGREESLKGLRYDGREENRGTGSSARGTELVVPAGVLHDREFVRRP
jgi:hypothetical protein